MKASIVDTLPHGVYRIYWKKKHGGGYSLAAVGSLHNGSRWFAPCNWTSSELRVVAHGDDWKKVKRVELIEA